LTEVHCSLLFKHREIATFSPVSLPGKACLVIYDQEFAEGEMGFFLLLYTVSLCGGINESSSSLEESRESGSESHFEARVFSIPKENFQKKISKRKFPTGFSTL